MRSLVALLVAASFAGAASACPGQRTAPCAGAVIVAPAQSAAHAATTAIAQASKAVSAANEAADDAKKALDALEAYFAQAPMQLELVGPSHEALEAAEDAVQRTEAAAAAAQEAYGRLVDFEKHADALAQQSAENAKTAAESEAEPIPDSAVEADSARPQHRAARHRRVVRPSVVATSASAEAAALMPLRVYLAHQDIPPEGVGGYGIVALSNKPTDADRAKLMMVCHDFASFFPTVEGSGVPAPQQMLTIWPIEKPFVADAAKDDCDFNLQHYDLVAAESAMADARRQGAKFEGEGPYLIGWAPSNTRGIPAKLVLTVDFTRDETPAEVDFKFRFWKQKIVEDPSAWRNGFSMERLRVGVADIADQFGKQLLDAIELVSAGGH